MQFQKINIKTILNKVHKFAMFVLIFLCLCIVGCFIYVFVPGEIRIYREEKAELERIQRQIEDSLKYGNDDTKLNYCSLILCQNADWNSRKLSDAEIQECLKPMRQEAYNFIETKALSGDSIAMYILGFLHNPYGNLKFYVPQDSAKFFKWIKKSAELGHTAAYCDLSDAYLNGIACVPDTALAYKWLMKGVEAEVANALRSYSYHYLHGLDYKDGKRIVLIPKDKEKALYWLEKAASKGSVKAKREYEDIMRRQK